MSTDIAWEEWGRRDPYYGVITDPKFRRSEMDDRIKREFFESGESHVHGVLTTIRRHVDPDFAPRTVLDFGCGVGRLLVSFAKIADEVVGVDVSSSMLQEAQRNCDERQLRNVRLLASDDSLSTLNGQYDLIHSCIVFQHIPVGRAAPFLPSYAAPSTRWRRSSSANVLENSLCLDSRNSPAGDHSTNVRGVRSIHRDGRGP